MKYNGVFEFDWQMTTNGEPDRLQGRQRSPSDRSAAHIQLFTLNILYI